MGCRAGGRGALEGASDRGEPCRPICLRRARYPDLLCSEIWDVGPYMARHGALQNATGPFRGWGAAIAGISRIM